MKDDTANALRYAAPAAFAAVAVCVVLLLVIVPPAEAQLPDGSSHVRGGTLSWMPIDEDTILVKGQLALRYSEYFQTGLQNLNMPPPAWPDVCQTLRWPSYPLPHYPFGPWPDDPPELPFTPPVPPPVPIPTPWPDDPMIHEEWPDDPGAEENCPDDDLPGDPRDPDDDLWPPFVPPFEEGDVVCNRDFGQLTVGFMGIPFCLHIIRVDLEEDWFVGNFVPRGADPRLDGIEFSTPPFLHALGQFTAEWRACCRLGSFPGTPSTANPGPDDHVNNPLIWAQLSTVINLTTPPNGPPSPHYVPIHYCVQNTVCTLRLPAMDVENDTVGVRWAAGFEPTTYMLEQPPSGIPFVPPPGARLGEPYLNETTGVWWVNITWDTRGILINPAAARTFYSAHVMWYDEVELPDGTFQERARVPYEFYIQIIDPRDVPARLPEWNAYIDPDGPLTIGRLFDEDHLEPEGYQPGYEVTQCGAFYEIEWWETLTFGMEAVHPGLIPMTLDALSIPPWATSSPVPAARGTPTVHTVFNGTPGEDYKGTRWFAGWAVQADDKGLPLDGPCTVKIIVKPEPNVPPVPAFRVIKPPCGQDHRITFINESFDVDGVIMDYVWDFGHPAADPAVWYGKNPPPVAYPEDGIYFVTLTVTDDGIPLFLDRPYGQPVTVTVGHWITALGNHNHAPAMGPLPDRTVFAGQEAEVFATATDPECDPLTFFALEETLPAGSIFTPTNARFAWVPTPSQVGVVHITLCVHDPQGLQDCGTFSVTVLDRVDPPPPCLLLPDGSVIGPDHCHALEGESGSPPPPPAGCLEIPDDERAWHEAQGIHVPDCITEPLPQPPGDQKSNETPEVPPVPLPTPTPQPIIEEPLQQPPIQPPPAQASYPLHESSSSPGVLVWALFGVALLVLAALGTGIFLMARRRGQEE